MLVPKSAPSRPVKEKDVSGDLEVGQLVLWISADADLPGGTVGRVVKKYPAKGKEPADVCVDFRQRGRPSHVGGGARGFPVAAGDMVELRGLREGGGRNGSSGPNDHPGNGDLGIVVGAVQRGRYVSTGGGARVRWEDAEPGWRYKVALEADLAPPLPGASRWARRRFQPLRFALVRPENVRRAEVFAVPRASLRSDLEHAFLLAARHGNWPG